MKNEERWKQRFANFQKALRQLSVFVEKAHLSVLEEQGMIKCFEYTYELSWNTMKDYFEFQGETGINGSRDAFRLGFKRGLIDDGEVWMSMIQSRVLTSHTYSQEIADQVATAVLREYYPLYLALEKKMETYL